MSLQDVDIKHTYRSSTDVISRVFYIPLLSQAIAYDRAVGFFSSTVLSLIYTGLSSLANRGGKVRIISSPKLSEEDLEAIKKGYKMRDEVIKKAIIREMIDPQYCFESKCLDQLANLVANGILDIKFAFVESNNNIGMYHEKMGLIYDDRNNVVAFSGSMNETYTAMSLNYESIDVFCSWKSTEQRDRVEEKKTAFSTIWNNEEPTISVLEVPEITEEIIRRYIRKPVKKYEPYDQDIIDFLSIFNIQSNRVIIPENISFYDYQIEAINQWEKNGFRGIFDMATGTGKTFTALGALKKLYDVMNQNLAVIIVCPFQHLVEQWVEDIRRFNIHPIIGYSTSSQKNWIQLLEDAIRDQKLSVKNRNFFCFITTNATFSLDYTQKLIEKINKNILLIVDEAHYFGTESLSSLLADKYNYRLALSATLNRHNDEEGTKRLYNYFGQKSIEYSLERAIQEKKLTPYKYFPVLTVLDENELKIYIQLSNEISRCTLTSKDGKTKLSERGKRLAIKRARIVAGASDKLVKLAKYIEPYKSDKHILVYCGATTILQYNLDYSEINYDDYRQIDAVTSLLGNTLGMKVAQFTSREDINKRELLKKEFAKGDTMQVLVAIKCLDEGMNIPNIKTAFILASTTNPKEYIQRRGRVLRLAEGKEYAEIYDFITLPRRLDEVHYLTNEQIKKEISLVRNEVVRAKEFARLAINQSQSEKVINNIIEVYFNNETSFYREEDNYYA